LRKLSEESSIHQKITLDMASPKAPTGYEGSILIVGAGTWGCSTALHLARRGYKYVTVLDPYELPSPISAGNDVNKIVEQGTSLPF
jgi:sarcosine oxidase/L-pipecolate oxidase